MADRPGWRSLLTAALATLSVGASGVVRDGGAPADFPVDLGLSDSAQVRRVIESGYRERLRLGLGSPFRLIDFALHDPRLDSISRVRLAHRLLEGTLQGDGYRIPPCVLDRVRNLHVPPSATDGSLHLELIREEIAAAGDPRAGEMAVRLAYGLAVMERSIDSVAFLRAASVAALLRDRELARLDARRLREEAERLGADPLALVPGWRRARLFRVEEPPSRPLPGSLLPEVAERATELLKRVRAVGVHPAHRAAAPDCGAPLPPVVASALARIAETTGMPPQTAVSVRVRMVDRVLSRPGVHPGAAWTRFAERAVDEERMVAEHALLWAREPRLRLAASTVLLHSAVDLRTFAQERPWFPGFEGPSSSDLEERYGVRVVVDGRLPDAWAPYYRGAVDGALAHLKLVLPRLDLRGTKIRIVPELESSWAIARHLPGKRTIVWPAATGPGTLAHEVAHEVDRRASRRVYGIDDAYASDRAARLRQRPLAPALETLAEGSRGIPRESHPRALRPAEVFARNVDWFVTRALAQAGITDGYLSSTQDEVLTGHGTVRPPGEPESYGAALLVAARVLLPVGPAQLDLLRQPLWTRLTPYAVLRLAGAGRDDGRWGSREGTGGPRRWIHAAGAPAADGLDLTGCGSVPPFVDGERVRAYRRLEREAVAALARARALAAAAGVGGDAARLWLLRELYGPPWPHPRIPPLLEGTLADLLAEAGSAAPLPDGTTDTPFGLPGGCGAGLLRSWPA